MVVCVVWGAVQVRLVWALVSCQGWASTLPRLGCLVGEDGGLCTGLLWLSLEEVNELMGFLFL